ncbi:MAG: EAL domain-containing protein [Candidatus Acidiferrales bacterium]
MGLTLTLVHFPSWFLKPPLLELTALVLVLCLYIGYQRLRRIRQNELFRIVSENAADMIALVEVTGKRLYNSPAYEKVLGYTAEELAATGSLEQVHPEDRERVVEAGKKARLTGEGQRLEYRMRHKDGKWHVLESTASVIRNRRGHVTHLVIVNRDITERKRVEERLEHEAFHDALTGLPNRSLFLDRLQHAIDHKRRFPEFKFAVLFVDIKGLKIFNETMGHAVVDQLIIDISHRLKARLRHDDTVSRTTPTGVPGRQFGDEMLARLDGDRFTVLLEDIKAPSDPMRVAMRLQESFAGPFTLHGVDAFTTASIGIAMSSDTPHSPAEMLRDADIAMCRAEAQGVSCCQVFDTAMHAIVVRRLKLETELRKAIDREELRVFFQPIVRLATGKIAGAEALVRWWHNESEIVGPADFIEVAEETGLIVPIGRWILKEACRQAHAWQLRYSSELPMTITINVSPRQLAQSNLVADVKLALEETKLAPSSLQLEITESMAMSNPKVTTRIFSQLKDLGVSLSIDDFGTGHSSLSRLRSFPVDVLKIDRSFISGIEQNVESREIARLIVTLAHHLDLKVIAEGIETPAQRAYLEQFGCEYGQGYLYSQPVDHDAFEKLLAGASRDSEESTVNVGSHRLPAN